MAAILKNLHNVITLSVIVQFRQNLFRPSGCGKGGEGDMRPGRHCAVGGIWRGENMKFWKLATSGELAFALQTVIFLHPFNTPPVGTMYTL